MEKPYRGVLFEIRNEGRMEGRRYIISRLLKKHSVEEVAGMLEMAPCEIEDMLDN